MTMRCSICTHPQADEINRLLAQGAPLRDIVGHVPDISKSALHRHRAHVALLLVAAKARADGAAGEDVLGAALEKLDAIEAEARRLARVAERRGELRIAAHLLVSEAVRLVELTARLKGLLSGSPAVMVAVSQRVQVTDPQTAARAAFEALVEEMPPSLRHEVGAWLQQRREQWLSAAMRQVREERRAMGLEGEVAQATEPDPPTVLPPAAAEEDTLPPAASGKGWALYMPDDGVEPPRNVSNPRTVT